MGKTWDEPNEGEHSLHTQRIASTGEPEGPAMPEAIVFIKGDNNIPNTIGTVEQADRWRQTYVVTDSGPVYRPGPESVCPESAATGRGGSATNDVCRRLCGRAGGLVGWHADRLHPAG